MGTENNSLNWKALKATLIVCVMLVLPAVANDRMTNYPLSAPQVVSSTSFKAKQNVSVSNSCAAYFKGTLSEYDCRVGEVPMPAATWLFLLALVAFVVLSTKRKV